MSEAFEHYESKYYDPVKAHEYYERTKKLKGRQTNGRKLNAEGLKAKSYVSKQISEERESVLKKERESTNQKVYQSSTEISNQIRQLQLQMKKLPADKKKTLGTQIQRKIASLRESNAKAKADFQRKYSEFAKTTRSKYSKTMDDEINKLYSDSSMVKPVREKKPRKPRVKKATRTRTRKQQ